MFSLALHVLALFALVIRCQGAISANYCMKQVFAKVKFNSSESMEYDPMTDVYFVSNNVAGTITKLDPNTNNASTFASVPGITLGLGVRNGVLYVAAGTNVTSFNTTSGAMIMTTKFNKVATLMANFTAVLNGLCINSMGTVVSTDVGVNFRAGNVPTQQNGVYTSAGKVVMTPMIVTQPNGCTFKNDRLCLGQFGRYPTILCADTTAMTGSYTGMNITGDYVSVDGLVYISGLKMLIAATWTTAGSSNFVQQGRIMGLKDGTTTWITIAEKLSGPADIGYDSKRNLLLVPELLTNKVYTINMTVNSSCPTTPMPTTTMPGTTMSGTTNATTNVTTNATTNVTTNATTNATTTGKPTDKAGAAVRVGAVIAVWLGAFYVVLS